MKNRPKGLTPSEAHLRRNLIRLGWAPGKREGDIWPITSSWLRRSAVFNEHLYIAYVLPGETLNNLDAYEAKFAWDGSQQTKDEYPLENGCPIALRYRYPRDNGYTAGICFGFYPPDMPPFNGIFEVALAGLITAAIDNGTVFDPENPDQDYPGVGDDDEI